jgi:hypothetical protein
MNVNVKSLTPDHSKRDVELWASVPNHHVTADDNGYMIDDNEPISNRAAPLTNIQSALQTFPGDDLVDIGVVP